MRKMFAFWESYKSIIFQIKAEQKDAVLAELKEGLFVKIKGMPVYSTYDRELEISNIVGIKKIADFTTKRMDTSELKRVELHCHTKMSDMDGTSEVKDLIKILILKTF